MGKLIEKIGYIGLLKGFGPYLLSLIYILILNVGKPAFVESAIGMGLFLLSFVVFLATIHLVPYKTGKYTTEK